MKKISIFLFGLSLVFTCCAQPSLSPQLDSLLTVYTRLNKFTGSVLVAKNGIVLLDKGYGYRDAAKKILNDPQTVYQIGSVTKQFTTAVILKLQEKKKLSIQDKLSKYFSDFPKGDSITIEHLMTHTSGIFNYTNDRDFMKNEVANPANREKIMAMFVNKPLDFSPGTKYSYSNSGYSMLGYIIEAATKQPYEQVVRQYIFTPLKMTHSGFDFTHLKVPEKATGYFVLNQHDTVLAPIVDSTVAFSAGAIYSTTGDLYRWHRSLQENKILSHEQQENAYRPYKNRYGYGWGTDSLDGKRRVMHGGGIHGFTSNISRLPQDDVCIILLSNTGSNALQDINSKIYAILYDKPYELPVEKKAINLPEEKLKEYTGTYQIRPELQITLSVKDGQLLAAPTNQPSVIAYAEKEDHFFIKDPDVQLKFIRNENKAITGLMLYQAGREFNCPKIK
jgi:CubicO group peptidase (beta-lactamase class C family)